MNIYCGAWGGSWGMSWAGSWGASWGPDEVEEHPERYGGRPRRHVVDDERLHREHWEYMDSLRESQARPSDVRKDADSQAKPPGHGVAVVQVQDAKVDRAMRGTIKIQEPPTVAEMLDDPLMLAALAVAIEEADD